MHYPTTMGVAAPELKWVPAPMYSAISNESNLVKYLWPEGWAKDEKLA